MVTASTEQPIATAPHPTDPIIRIRGLTKRYRHVTAVNGIDLDVRPGEIFGILGPNGAGKSTTLEMIEGLRKPDGGTIFVDGIDAVKENDRVRKIIGVQLQSTSLFPYLSAREIIALFGNFYELEHPEARVDELLGLVDLREKGNARVDELSGGQQQRLGIALALVNNPRVAFLDEPTTGLDPHARRNLWETILGVRRAGTTVVLTTHYMEEAEVLCDRIAIMDGGNVIACDTPAGLIRSLDLEAVVSATVVSSSTALSEAALGAIPGVGQATLSNDAVTGVTRLSLHTRDAQATIVGLLSLASETGTVLGELGSTRANLENVFLSLTGRTYEQEDTAENGTADGNGERKKRRRGRDAT
jgi:ABC-2 type transport system ATP-binding protein